MSLEEEKRKIREKIWRILEERNVARFPRPVYGRIPNFEGAEIAGKKIVMLKEFRDAKVVKVSPDSPQTYIRLTCLREGKLLVMPTPRLREGFLVLDPSKIPRKMYEKAATIKGAFIFGEKINPRDLPEIDFIVVGSVAVGLDGSRIGKGEGYSEIEYAILREYSRVGEETLIATNIHDLQLIDRCPTEPYDVSVDIIATPTKLIRVSNRAQRPRGIIWSLIDEKKIHEIPLLKILREENKDRL
ncbi:MAG: 5-formyltetrahydrofolate cyclo-ligase [Nitrososphaerota archaeon]|nr:5-formyltetrahydrofolate cyclo-ligase [Candidatus Geocrenenecus dongiae]